MLAPQEKKSHFNISCDLTREENFSELTDHVGFDFGFVVFLLQPLKALNSGIYMWFTRYIHKRCLVYYAFELCKNEKKNRVELQRNKLHFLFSPTKKLQITSLILTLLSWARTIQNLPVRPIRLTYWAIIVRYFMPNSIK